MFRMQLFGHLGGDARLVPASNGRTFLAFSVAHNHTPKDSAEVVTTWVDCTWNKDLDPSRLSRGRFVYIAGYPTFSTYVPKTGGAPRIAVSLRVSEFEFLDSMPS